MNKPKQCKLCTKKTSTVFNINFKAVSICESCASSIFIQQAQWLNSNRTIEGLKKVFDDSIKNQKDITPEIKKIIDEKYWDLL